GQCVSDCARPTTESLAELRSMPTVFADPQAANAPPPRMLAVTASAAIPRRVVARSGIAHLLARRVGRLSYSDGGGARWAVSRSNVAHVPARWTRTSIPGRSRSTSPRRPKRAGPAGYPRDPPSTDLSVRSRLKMRQLDVACASRLSRESV